MASQDLKLVKEFWYNGVEIKVWKGIVEGGCGRGGGGGVALAGREAGHGQVVLRMDREEGMASGR